MDLVFLILLALSYGILGIFMLHRKPDGKYKCMLFGVGYLFRLIVVALIYCYSSDPYGSLLGKDEIFYIRLAETHFHSGVIPFDLLISRNYGYVFFDWTHMYFFNSTNILFPVVTNSFLSTITFFMISDEIDSILDGNTGSSRTLLAILVLFPDMILVGAQNLKDTLLLFVIVMYIKSIIALTKNGDILMSTTCAIIASYLTFTLRFYISFVQVFLLIVVILKKYRFSIKQILLLPLIVVTVLFVSTRVPSIARELELIKSLGITRIFDDYFVFTQARDGDYFLRGVVKGATGYSPKILVITTGSIILTPYFVKIFSPPLYVQYEVLGAGVLWGYFLFFLLAALKIGTKSVEEKVMFCFSVLVMAFHSFTPYLADGRHRISILWALIILAFSESTNHTKLIRTVVIIFSLVLMLILQLIGDVVFS